MKKIRYTPYNYDMAEERRKGTPKGISPKDISFRRLLLEDKRLSFIRLELSNYHPEIRRLFAYHAYTSLSAPRFASGIVNPVLDENIWYKLAHILSLDCQFAPAFLSAGIMEYGYGRIDEAVGLFMGLLNIEERIGETTNMINEAGSFLINRKEFLKASELYEKAITRYPGTATFFNGLSYCASRLDLYEQAVEYAIVAAELEPYNFIILSDLGWTLIEAGLPNEAQIVLEKAVCVSPPSFTLARRNLEEAKRRLREYQN